jgi:hypothetical protein
MPINTIQVFLRDTLSGLVLPLGLGNLTSVISPPNPGDGTDATAYIWGSSGREARMALPRGQFSDPSGTGGEKRIIHNPNVWLVWFGSSEETNIDVEFPAIVDAVMATIRNAPLTDASQHSSDPVTGALSQVLAVGENMSYEYGPVRGTTADQRIWRFDAQLTVEVVEVIQA